MPVFILLFYPHLMCSFHMTVILPICVTSSSWPSPSCLGHLSCATYLTTPVLSPSPAAWYGWLSLNGQDERHMNSETPERSFIFGLSNEDVTLYQPRSACRGGVTAKGCGARRARAAENSGMQPTVPPSPLMTSLSPLSLFCLSVNHIWATPNTRPTPTPHPPPRLPAATYMRRGTRALRRRTPFPPPLL